MAILLKPDEEPVEVRPADGESFSLEELYSLLNCRTVEMATLDEDRRLWFDEEARLKRLHPESKINRKASALYGYVILGNALLEYAADGEFE